MSRLPSHVEDELQTFLKLFCPNAILLRSKVPKESILVKDELHSRVLKKKHRFA